MEEIRILLVIMVVLVIVMAVFIGIFVWTTLRIMAIKKDYREKHGTDLEVDAILLRERNERR